MGNQYHYLTLCALMRAPRQRLEQPISYIGPIISDTP
jgi:hypothetical protein